MSTPADELQNAAAGFSETAPPPLEGEVVDDVPPPEEAGPPPPDPRTVALVEKLLHAVGTLVAPRWLAIVKAQDREYVAQGLDGVTGLGMLAEAAVPVIELYFPDLKDSPVINLCVVGGLVLAPCVGEPLRDPPKPKDQATSAPSPGGPSA